MMRTMLIALLAASAFALTAASTGTAAPAGGAVIAETADAAVTPAHYVRRHGRTCYRKCYREFVVTGRRVCRTYCDWW